MELLILRHKKRLRGREGERAVSICLSSAVPQAVGARVARVRHPRGTTQRALYEEQCCLQGLWRSWGSVLSVIVVDVAWPSLCFSVDTLV